MNPARLLVLLLIVPACAGSVDACPEGSTPEGDICLVQGDGVTCGQGTKQSGDVCVPVGAFGMTCGAGTHAVAGQCVTDGSLICGAGTHASQGACVPDQGGLSCGPGTHATQGVCVADASSLSCGAGTHQAGAECVPDGDSEACGAGTHDVSGTCVPDGNSASCGAGTHDVGGLCVPDATTDGSFQVFVGASQIPADGYTKIPVLAVGTDATGNPSNALVVLSPSRADAGSIAPSTLTLGPAGATTYFTACNAAQDPSCLGPFNVTLALGSDPSVIVASSAPVQLVAPQGVGSSAPCLVGGNVLFFDGSSGDYIHPGTDTIQVGMWSADGASDHVAVHVTPSSSTQGLWWDLDFSTEQLGQPLTTQVYTGAERFPFEPPGKPGLDVGGDGRGCNVLTGSFQVEELTRSAGSLHSFTATFVQHCEGGSAALRGCVHYAE